MMERGAADLLNTVLDRHAVSFWSCWAGPHTCPAANAALQDNTCTNGIQDNFETDVDCGGPLCAPCADGQQCQLPEDCESQNCPPSGVCNLVVSWLGCRAGVHM